MVKKTISDQPEPTAVPSSYKVREEDVKELAKCPEGFHFDSVTGTCVQDKDKKKKGKRGDTDVFTDPETGDVTGFVSESGEVYFGNFNPDDIKEMIRKKKAKYTLPEGAVDLAAEARERARVEQELAPIARQVGEVPEQVGEAAPIDFTQAGAAGVAAAGAGTVGGLAIGSLGGPAAPITSTAAALIGGGIGFTTGFIANLRAQRGGEVGATTVSLEKGRENLLRNIQLANLDPARAGEYVEGFNNQLIMLDKARADLKAETDGVLTSFLGDGRRELANFETFNSPNGFRDSMERQMQLAVLNPDPNRVVMGIQDLPPLEE